VKVKFEAKFAKDLRAIRDQKLLNKVKEIIEDCKSVNTLSEINHIKKMQGYDSFYRIRLADYRIGIEIINDEIIFTRFLHRKDVYKYFP
jgi:mRNA interferase RelE/StbE